jgi:hypothetical protein
VEPVKLTEQAKMHIKLESETLQGQDMCKCSRKNNIKMDNIKGMG